MDQLFFALKGGHNAEIDPGFFEELTAEEINEQDEKGATVLSLASSFGRTDIVKMMLSACPNIDVNSQNKDLGSTALMLAISHTRNDVAEMLLAYPGIDVNLQSNFGLTALHIATEQNSLDLVEKLLVRTDIDVNLQMKNGRTAFMNTFLDSLLYNRKTMVRKLLDCPKVDINLADEDGFSALMVVAAHGNELEVGSLLKCSSVDVNLRNKNGDTALILAIRNCNPKVVQLLIKRADTQVNIQNKTGVTALMCASVLGDRIMVKALLTRADIDLDLTDERDETASHKAKTKKIRDMIKMHGYSFPSGKATTASTITKTHSATSTVSVPVEPSEPASQSASTKTPAHGWLAVQLLASGMFEAHALDCEQKIVYNEGFCTENDFARLLPSKIDNAYLTCIGITGLGTQERVLQLQRELHEQYTQSTAAPLHAAALPSSRPAAGRRVVAAVPPHRGQSSKTSGGDGDLGVTSKTGSSRGVMGGTSGLKRTRDGVDGPAQESEVKVEMVAKCKKPKSKVDRSL